VTATAPRLPLTDPVLAADAVRLCSRLIQFDTTNFGGGKSRGERECAEWVAAQLTGAGYQPVILESVPGRANTVVRIPGADRQAPGLLMHGHLDVVPAAAQDWSVDPFGGEIRDGAVWGRGAVDMKDMDAMMLAVALWLERNSIVPPRDIVLAFVADEEDTSAYGAGFLAREHPELFAGVGTAISETGGYSIHLPDGGRLYPIATGERGSAWMTLTARGTAGHGSRPNPDNAVATLVAAVDRLARHRWPVCLTPAVATLVDGLQRRLGVTVDVNDPDSLAAFGDAAAIVRATLANSLNPTMLAAGYKHNVIPSEASAGVDGRILPGTEQQFLATVDELLGAQVTREFVNYSPPVAAPHDGPEFAAMAAAIQAADPQALVLPYWMAGGTDAKPFSELGIHCYGFAPGSTPPDFHLYDYMHGVDEHVLVDSLTFGVRVLADYATTGLVS
jgi:acetylornithine deacetylase/succinyl-diaminopimelate desuccinylase-like protein